VTSIQKLDDKAWTLYEEVKPLLTPAQANWCITLFNRNNANSYKAVIEQLNKVKESKG
jgi:hypothetical protein